MKKEILNEKFVYKNWILSLQPTLKIIEPFDLIEETKKLLLINIFEILRPNTIDWNMIEKSPSNYYKQLSNLTFLFESMRRTKIVILSIRPADILEGKTTAIYSILWNFMRIYFLEQVSQKADCDEEMILKWIENFKEITVQAQICLPDEMINGEDKDFLYKNLFSNDNDAILDFESARINCKSVELNQFGVSEPIHKLNKSFESIVKPTSRPVFCSELKLKTKEIFKKTPGSICFDLLSDNEDDSPIKSYSSLQFGIKKEDQQNVSVKKESYVHPFATKTFSEEKIQEKVEPEQEKKEKFEDYIEKLISRSFFAKIDINLDEKDAVKLSSIIVFSQEIDNLMTKNVFVQKKISDDDLSVTYFLQPIANQIFKNTENSSGKRIDQSFEFSASLERARILFKKKQKPRIYSKDFIFDKNFKKIMYNTIKSKFNSPDNNIDTRLQVLKELANKKSNFLNPDS